MEAKTQERDAKKQAFEDKVQEAENKLAEAENARRDIERKQKDADGVTSPVDPLQPTPERETAFNNLFDGTQWKRDYEQELADADPSTGVNPWVASFEEGSDFGIDDLGMLPCGLDLATTAEPSAACDGLVLCAPDEPHCSCSQATDIGETAAQLAEAADLACALVINCPEDSEGGMGELGCTCAGEEPDIDLDDVGPDVTGPTPRFLQAVFANLGVVRNMKLSTTERAMVGAVRDDVGVGEAMTDEFGR